MPTTQTFQRVLVTGGAGFIGSHAVLELLGMPGIERIVIVDDLSRGSSETLDRLRALDAHKKIRVYQWSILQGELNYVLDDECIEAVLHFAAPCYVAESLADPLFYFEQIVEGTRRVLRALARSSTCRRFIFSSTSSTYGDSPGDTAGLLETDLQNPTSPYGWAKLAAERQVLAFQQSRKGDDAVRVTILRYFNVIGCDPEGRIGPMWKRRFRPYSRLIDAIFYDGGAIASCPTDADGTEQPRVFSVLGTDYPTRDGTAVRDYIHVSDLVHAHVLALERQQEPVLIANVGLQGFTVLEVLAAVERVTGQSIARRLGDRRPGDPAVAVASTDVAHRFLGWEARHTDLDDMIRHQWNWHREHPSFRD